VAWTNFFREDVSHLEKFRNGEMMTGQPYSDRTAFSPDNVNGIDIGFLTVSGFDYHYVRSFYESAELLIETLLPDATKKQNDRIVFSVCYLFRQYLELQCKYLIECAWHLDNAGKFTPKFSHSLRELWDETRKVVEPKISDTTIVPFDSVQSIIYQFHDADPTGQEFRYARTTKGLQSLQNIPSSFSVIHLHAAMRRADTFLHQWAWELDLKFDADNYFDY
jgi:hypothetical protein